MFLHAPDSPPAFHALCCLPRLLLTGECLCALSAREQRCSERGRCSQGGCRNRGRLAPSLALCPLPPHRMSPPQAWTPRHAACCGTLSWASSEKGEPWSSLPTGKRFPGAEVGQAGDGVQSSQPSPALSLPPAWKSARPCVLGWPSW